MARRTDPNNNHLLVLYQQWKANPEKYQEAWAKVIDSVIHSTLATTSLRPFYWRVEELEDLYQELRALLFKKLNRIQNPTNKRIFNFLRITIKFYLREKARTVGKRMDRENIENSHLGEQIKTPDENLVLFADPQMNEVAQLLIAGRTRKEIRSRTDLSVSAFNNVMANIKKQVKQW